MTSPRYGRIVEHGAKPGQYLFLQPYRIRNPAVHKLLRFQRLVESKLKAEPNFS